MAGSVQSLVMVSGRRWMSAWVLVTMLGWIAAMALGLASSSQGDSQVLTGNLAAIQVAWTVAMATLFPKPEKRGTNAHIRWWWIF